MHRDAIPGEGDLEGTRLVPGRRSRRLPESEPVLDLGLLGDELHAPGREAPVGYRGPPPADGSRAQWCYTSVMLKQIRLRRAGGSVSATLPKEMADRLNIGAGDDVFAVETRDGILLTPYDEVTARAMQTAREGAQRYRNALRRLAE